MSIKIYFVIAHLNYFPDNRVDYSEELGEFFNQDISTVHCIEDRYNGNVIINIIDDYCWSLKSDINPKRDINT